MPLAGSAAARAGRAAAAGRGAGGVGDGSASGALPGVIAATCERAGVAGGVGSNVTQPSAVEPRLDPRVGVGVADHPFAEAPRKPPGVKPVATRAGIPPMRSSSAIAPEKCWQ